MSLKIPSELLPRDGRFGSGPSKIRPDALNSLVTRGDIMGTSHRKPPVRNLVKRVQESLAELYHIPDSYEVVLGCGGATIFWDVAAFSLVKSRSAHGIFGEFGAKFAKEIAGAPFLADPVIYAADNGKLALPEPCEVDVAAWAQNETSTGVAAPVRRLDGFDSDTLFVIDATSSAGGMAADLTQSDVFFFSPQKNLSADGGLWFAICSPAAVERAHEVCSSRWVPAGLDLVKAITNSRKNQTLNTPAIATLLLVDAQLSWLLDNGGLDFAAGRTAESSSAIYSWAEESTIATPFVAEKTHRSPVTCTIDFDESVDANKLIEVLNDNGILDISPYRSLGRNQLRIATFASIDPADVQALLVCIDWVLDSGIASR